MAENKIISIQEMIEAIKNSDMTDNEKRNIIELILNRENFPRNGKDYELHCSAETFKKIKQYF